MKGVKDGLRGCFLWSVRMSLRVDFFDLLRKSDVNCLQKELEMDLDLVWILGPKDIG